MAIAQSNRIHISVYSWSLIFYLQVNPNTPTMAYNQQQQQPQQYVVAGQMINIGNQVLEQQQQFVTVDPNVMGSAVGKINFLLNSDFSWSKTSFIYSHKYVILLFSAQFEIQPAPRQPVKPFDPSDHDLDANFRLTRFADLKGWGCKVPQEVLLKLLEGLKEETGGQNPYMQIPTPTIGKTNFYFVVINPLL